MVERKERKLTTTVALTPNLEARLKERAVALEVYQSDVIRKALERFLDEPEPKASSETIKLSEIRKHIVEAVASNLRTHTEWAQHTVQDMLLLAEGGSVFAERMEHFLDEKRYLANQLVPWLIERILFLLRGDLRIYLVIDSGTSLYWVFRVLDEKLREHLATDDKTRDLLKRLVILTNNTAGSFSYIAASNADRSDNSRLGGGKKGVVLADHIKCQVLGGEIVTRYAATLGPETVTSLRRARENAPDSDVKFIGLLAGQWVRLDEKDHHPIALARGFGQSAFKREMLLHCDEVILISPLAKIFHRPYAEICEGLCNDVSGKSYVDVGEVDKSELSAEETQYWTDHWETFQTRSQAVRLVTTFRTKPDQALYAHSGRLQQLFGRWAEPTQQSAHTDFSSLPHFHCRFDLPFGLNEWKEQCEIEFPHVPPVGEARPGDVSLAFLKEAFLLPEPFASWLGPRGRK